MRDGHNGYGPSAGIAAGARSGRPTEYTARGFPVSADRVFITAGTSEGIELALTAPRRRRRRSARADADLSARTPRCSRSSARSAAYYRTRSGARLDAGPRSPREPRSRRRRARSWSSIRTTRPARSIRRRRGARCSTSPSSTACVILADEVYGDLGYDGPVPPLGSLDPDAPIISFSSLSKAYLAPGWRTGWMAIGRIAAARRRAGGGEEAGGRPAVQHGADAVRGRRGADRRPVAPGVVPRGA